MGLLTPQTKLEARLRNISSPHFQKKIRLQAKQSDLTPGIELLIDGIQPKFLASESKIGRIQATTRYDDEVPDAAWEDWREKNSFYGGHTTIKLDGLELYIDGALEHEPQANMYVKEHEFGSPLQRSGVFAIEQLLDKKISESQTTQPVWFSSLMAPRIAEELYKHNVPFKITSQELGDTIDPTRTLHYELAGELTHKQLTRRAEMRRQGFFNSGLKTKHIREMETFIKNTHPHYQYLNQNTLFIEEDYTKESITES